MKKHFWIIIIVLIFYNTNLHVYSQNVTGAHFIKNFTIDEIGMSTQIWAVIQDKR